MCACGCHINETVLQILKEGQPSSVSENDGGSFLMMKLTKLTFCLDCGSCWTERCIRTEIFQEGDGKVERQY